MPDDRAYPSGGVHGQVVYQIGRQIVSGEIAVGSDLPREVELCERFGTSRQAIREAIKVLAAKGLIEPRRRRGTRVRPRAAWNLLDPDVLLWHAPDGFGPDFLADLLELRAPPASGCRSGSAARRRTAMPSMPPSMRRSPPATPPAPAPPWPSSSRRRRPSCGR
jgi:DNA-binding FadR family transcriptional regulator